MIKKFYSVTLILLFAINAAQAGVLFSRTSGISLTGADGITFTGTDGS